MRKIMIALSLLLTCLPTLAVAAADEPAAEVLFLGAYHFDNPGLDYVKSEVADVLTETKQKEIADVVERLSRFRPTKIVLEWPRESNAEANRRYAEYRAGKLAPERGEEVQIGFRLAKMLGHEQVYAIDVKSDMALDRVVAAAQKSDPEFLSVMQSFLGGEIATQQRMQKESSVRDTLRRMNEPSIVAHGHRLYVRMARVGDDGVGAGELAGWYSRNIRIFGNLARITNPGDRVLVIFGAGHTAILQQLARDMPGMKVVEANDFL